jgi:leucyl aminopeptidase
MNFKISVGTAAEIPAEVVVIGLPEETSNLTGAAAAMDSVLNGQISSVLASGDFKGKGKELALLYSADKQVKRVLLVGLGKKESISADGLRSSAGVAAKRIRELGVNDCTFSGFFIEGAELMVDVVIQSMVEGITLALYEFNALKAEKSTSEKSLEEITLFVSDESQRDLAETGLQAGKSIAAGVCLARDLVNYPGNYATPTFLAERASDMAGQVGLTCRILDEQEMAEFGMGALLGVSQGSEQPAKLIILEHNPDKAELETVVLVGKGVTFDSGGISIKPGEGMERMTSDMAGGAAVIGALLAVAELDLPLHVIGLVPATENLPSGKALKPGDVLTAMNGTTIEIINTDAEGRLILADALCYASRFNPAAVIDIATLTGARNIALGEYAIGLFSSDDALVSRLSVAGQKTFERVWAMPMFAEYADSLKSVVADCKHTGGRAGGSIVAAKFLAKFTQYPWAHLDIAGMVLSDSDKPFAPKGANGLGVRLLVQLLRDWKA